MKIIVYAIAKNEERNYEGFLDNVAESDGVFILDTGSDDKKAAKHAVIMGCRDVINCPVHWSDAYEENDDLPPGVFDFAAARNNAYALAFDQFHNPNELTYYISLDLDERLEKGWCSKLKSLLEDYESEPYTEIDFTMNITHEANPYTYDAKRGHLELMCEWVYPVHEVLDHTAEEVDRNKLASGINIVHKPDDNKARDYLPGLMYGIQTYPYEPRMYHYAGRELMMRGNHLAALKIFQQYISLGENGIYLWAAETAIIYNYIAFCYEHIGDYDLVEQFFYKAALEMPHCREPWLDISDYYHRKNDMLGAYFYLKKAISLPYTDEYMYTKAEAYGHLPHHQASFFAHQLGFKEASIQHIKDAAGASGSKLTPALVSDYVTLCGELPPQFQKG